MKTFIESEKINILCDSYGKNDKNTNENNSKTFEKAEGKQSVWKKIASKAKGVWERAKPIISELTTFIATATAFLKAVTKLKVQCNSMKGAFA